MGNWTPGPWYVDQYGDIEANGESVANISGFYGEETNDANARLIAAAPDLLAALIALNDDYKKALAAVAKHDGPVTSRLSDEADAAIAKATGVSP